MTPNISKLLYDQRLTKVGLWSLEDRRLRADLIEVYKIIHGLSSVSFHLFFEFSHHDWTRGHTLKLHKHSIRTDLRHFFTERIINEWNKLDEDTVSATSLNSFKRRQQKMYSDESFPRLTQSAWLFMNVAWTLHCVIFVYISVANKVLSLSLSSGWASTLGRPKPVRNW